MRREASSAARSDCTCPCAPRATTARPSFESEAVPASSGAEASNGRSSGAFVGVLRSERTIGQAATTTNTAEAARAFLGEMNSLMNKARQALDEFTGKGAQE